MSGNGGGREEGREGEGVGAEKDERTEDAGIDVHVTSKFTARFFFLGERLVQTHLRVERTKTSHEFIVGDDSNTSAYRDTKA